MKNEAQPEAYYDELWRKGRDYARYNPGGRHRRRLILDCLKRLEFRSLLDVGCGGGYLLQEINAALDGRVELAGADLSPLVIEGNQRRFPGIAFFQLNIQEAAPPRSYDFVICSEVIEHLEDRARALRNLAAGLSKGGHLLLTFPTGPVYPTDRMFGHTIHPTIEEIHGHARQSSLEVVDTRAWGWPFFDLYRWAINVSPGWSFKNFAEQSYGFSKKTVAQVVYLLSLLDAGSGKRGNQALMLLKKL